MGRELVFPDENSPWPIDLSHAKALNDAAGRVRAALKSQGITGANNAEIDHIEFFGPPVADDAHSRNFVYCPGGEYDRSPCGTGTSAKLACLAVADKLAPGETWVQESITGGRFLASYRVDDRGWIFPRITGRAFVCSEGTLIQQPSDPYRCGIL